MTDLRAQLNTALKGRVCLVGIGNVELGDDGFGVRLAEALAPVGQASGLPVPGASGSVDPMLMHLTGFRSADIPVGLGFTNAPKPTGMSALLPNKLPTLEKGELPAISPRISVVLAGTSPEIRVNRLGHFDHVIFLDAVHFSGAPGSVVFLDAREMAARFPQVSTHKLSLGLLAGMVESNDHTRAWLLGVQPESLKSGGHLTPTVHRTLTMLAELLSEMLAQASVQSAIRNPQSAIA